MPSGTQPAAQQPPKTGDSPDSSINNAKPAVQSPGTQTKPVVTSASSSSSKTGIKGTQMTVEQLKVMINVDNSINKENKAKWMGVITTLQSLSEAEQNSLLSKFLIN